MPLAVKAIPEVEQWIPVNVAVKVLPDATVAAENFDVVAVEEFIPEAEVKVMLVKVAEVAPSGNPPTVNETTAATLLHNAALAANGLNPLDVVVMLLEGLKMPMLYRITATMTMIKIAQP